MATKKKKLPKLERFDKIEIEWADAMQDQQGWVDMESFEFAEHADLTPCLNVGYFIKHEGEHIFICFGRNKDSYLPGVLSVFSIPTGAIISIRKLK